MEKLIQKFRQSDFDIFALRAGVFLVFLVYGIFKWMQFEVDALEAMLPKTWLVFLYPLLGAHGVSYLLGVVEGVAYGLYFFVSGLFQTAFEYYRRYFSRRYRLCYLKPVAAARF